MFSTTFLVFKKERMHFLAGQKGARLAGIFWIVATETSAYLLTRDNLLCSSHRGLRDPMGWAGSLAQD